MRFFLHAPLQLASVLFAATTTPDVCGALLRDTAGVRCIGLISALQLTLGLLLPTVLVYWLESRSGRTFMPHMQAKKLMLFQPGLSGGGGGGDGAAHALRPMPYSSSLTAMAAG